MSAELKIREALAELKPEVLKPWVKLDGLPYLHATDDTKASPWGTPVVGRFDYMETADYIAACNPVAIAELLAELDRLRTVQPVMSSAVQDFRKLLRAEIDAIVDVSGNIARQEAQIDQADHLLVKFNELFKESL